MKEMIYCNIHKRINIVDEVIYDLIRTIEFQRLNRIKQLGLLHYLFPGATHTRYAHSLGVFELAQKMLKNLEINSDVEINDKDKIIIKIAALLHDLGHGPLSHLFEEINPNIKHEQYTINIIKNPDTEVNEVLKKYLNSEDIDDVIKIISKSHPIPWFNQIISSDVDVDRLDYLMRDSFHTGVKYGDIDIEWLIQNAIIFDNQLTFKPKSLEVLESIIFGRYHMYTSVYLNLKTLAFSEQIKFLFNRVRELNLNKFSFKNDFGVYEPVINNETLSTESLLKLNDDNLFVFIEQMSYEDDKIIKKITSNILKGIIPEITWLSDAKELKKFESETFNLIKNQEFEILEQNKNFNQFYLNEDDPKIVNNKKLIGLFDLSTIIKYKYSKKSNQIINQRIGIKI